MTSAAIRLAAFLVAIYVASGVSTAFLPLFLSARGLSPAAIGQILAIATLARLVTGPAWGRFADRAGSRRQILLAASSISALSAFAAFPAHGYWPLLLAIIAQGIGSVSLMPLSDTLCLAMARTGTIDYGRIRAVGSIAFMAATTGAGLIVTYCGAPAIPVMLGISFATAALLTGILPETHTPRTGPRATGGLRLLRSRAFLLTLAATALVQGAHGAYYAVATLHWRAHGIGDTAIGLLWSEGVLAEITLFLFGRRLADRIGPGGLTAIAAASAVIRWTVTAGTTALVPLICVQLLHGATFGMQHLSAMRMLTRIVPPERAATAQTLHSTLGAIAPIGLTIWISGALYDGSGRVFLLMAVLGGAGLLLSPSLARAWRTHGA